MATITLSYDSRNVLATKTIDYILSLGIFSAIKKEKKTGIDMALEDVRKGNIHTYNSIDDLLKKIKG
jgi:hypothetical protein